MKTNEAVPWRKERDCKEISEKIKYVPESLFNQYRTKSESAVDRLLPHQNHSKGTKNKKMNLSRKRRLESLFSLTEEGQSIYEERKTDPNKFEDCLSNTEQLQTVIKVN